MIKCKGRVLEHKTSTEMYGGENNNNNNDSSGIVNESTTDDARYPKRKYIKIVVKKLKYFF